MDHQLFVIAHHCTYVGRACYIFILLIVMYVFLTSSKKSSGMFGMFRGLVGSKELTKENLRPVLDKMSDHLIGKNVASNIAEKLCDSVSVKLEGKVLGTFSCKYNLLYYS